nr:probable transport protein, chloroplastic [Tanacetum cinerariifolium]
FAARRAGHPARHHGLGLDLPGGRRAGRSLQRPGLPEPQGHAWLSGGRDFPGDRRHRAVGPDHRSTVQISSLEGGRMGSVTATSPIQLRPAPVTTAATPRLRVDNVTLQYKTPSGSTFTALDKVSFDVPDQQFAVLVGPSGCGKSSLLYLTAGLAEPTSGDIYVGGQQVDGPGADRGMVFQGYTLFPWLTVRKNIEFGLKRRGMPAAERKEIVEFYLNEVGLTRFADNYAKQLS